MIQLNLKDIDKAKIMFNYLLQFGFIEEFTKDMITLDTRYTEGTDKDGIAIFIHAYSEMFTTKVSLYKPFWRWSSAYATTYTGDFTKIKLNQYKINRSVASLCGSIAHEWGHCLEYYTRQFHPEIQFNHGDNSPVGKETTFQYQLGKAVKAYIEESGDEFLPFLGLK